MSARSNSQRTGGVPLTASLAKEIQRLIAFKCYESILPVGSMKRPQIERRLFEVYHGCTFDSNGIIWPRTDFDDDDDADESARLGDTRDAMVVKFFHETTICRYLDAGLVRATTRHRHSGIALTSTEPAVKPGPLASRPTLSLRLLHAKSFLNQVAHSHIGHKDCISGKNLYQKAQEASHMSFAAALIGAEFLDHGQLPDDRTPDEYLRFVSDRMHGQLYGSGEVPQGAFFPGWMAFYLFGPMADPSSQSRLIMSHMRAPNPTLSIRTGSTTHGNARGSTLMVAAVAVDDPVALADSDATSTRDESASAVASTSSFDGADRGAPQLNPASPDAALAPSTTTLSVDTTAHDAIVLAASTNVSSMDTTAHDAANDTALVGSTHLESLERIATLACNEAIMMQAKLREMQQSATADASQKNVKIIEAQHLYEQHRLKRHCLGLDFDIAVVNIVQSMGDDRGDGSTTTGSAQPLAALTRISLSPQPAGKESNTLTEPQEGDSDDELICC